VIHFFVQDAEARFVEEYLGFWGQAVAGRFRVRRLEALTPDLRLEAGPCILSGYDQLGSSGRALVQRLARQIAATPGVPLLNHPAHVLQRAALLETFHAQGWNDFRAVPVGAPLEALRYPVFLRRASRHDGPLTPLLHSRRELDAAIGWERLRGQPMHDLLVVEYLDTSIDGAFRKYAAFVVGDRVIARSLSFGRLWMRKHHSSDFSQAMVEEELEYVSTNPHASELAERFARANVQYGRIDYSLQDGRIQTWEINLSPTIGRTGATPSRRMPPALEPVRTETKRVFYAAFGEAFEAIDTVPVGAPALRITLPGALLDATREEQRLDRLARPGKTPDATIERRMRLVRIGKALARPVLSVLLPPLGRWSARLAGRTRTPGLD
jgi:hypothetical protein